MESVEKLLEALKQNNFVCTICTNLLVTPSQIQCGHIFCAPCIHTIQTSKTCPLCRAKVSRRDLKVRCDVDDLLKAIVFDLIPTAVLENSNDLQKNSNVTVRVDKLISSSSSDSSDSDNKSEEGPPPKKFFLNREKSNEMKENVFTGESHSVPEDPKAKEIQGADGSKSKNDPYHFSPSQKQYPVVGKRKRKMPVNRKVTTDVTNNASSGSKFRVKTPTSKVLSMTRRPQQTSETPVIKRNSMINAEDLQEIVEVTEKLLEPLVQEQESMNLQTNADNAVVVADNNLEPLGLEQEPKESHSHPILQEQTTVLENIFCTPVQEDLQPEIAPKQSKIIEKVLVDQQVCYSVLEKINVQKKISLDFQLDPQEKPLDLSMMKENVTCSFAKLKRSALIFVKPLDLSISNKNSNVILNAIPEIQPLEKINVQPLPNKLDALSTKTSYDNKSDLVSSPRARETSSNSLIEPRKLDFNEVSDIVMEYIPKVNLNEDRIDKPEQIIEEILVLHKNACDEDQIPCLLSLQNDVSIAEPNNNFDKDTEVSPTDTKSSAQKARVNGIYSKLDSTPVSCRSIERGRLDDSVSDLFKDYLSQEKKIISGDTVLEKIIEIPDDDSIFSEDEIPASQTSRGTSPAHILPIPRNYVFCPTRLTKLQLSKLNELCAKCGGSIVKEYKEDVTHLIINLENYRVPQTMKYLFAIADKKWIITFDWVEECIKHDEIVNEEAFETSSFPECDSGVRKSRVSLNSLFEGINFYFAGILKSSGASIEDCKKLMEKLGGRIICSPYAEDRNVMIIGDPLTMRSRYQEWYKSKGWITVSWEWILDCILTYSVIPFSKSHLITELDSAGLSQAALPDALLSLYKL